MLFQLLLPCTVEQRDVWGLPPHVHGQIYLHSTDGQHHFQWKNPAPAPAPALDPAPPLLLPPPPPALTLPSDWKLTDTERSELSALMQGPRASKVAKVDHPASAAGISNPVAAASSSAPAV